MVSLRVVHSDNPTLLGQRFEVRPITRIGRDLDNDIVLEEESVSRHHARLEHGELGWVLHDEGSANGIRVGSERFSTLALSRGMRFRIGGVTLELTGAHETALDTDAMGVAPTLLAVPVVRPERPARDRRLGQRETPAAPPREQMTPEGRAHSTWVATLASLLLPGAGQAYNGEPGKGLIVLLGAPLVVPWLYGILDAMRVSTHIVLAGGRSGRGGSVWLWLWLWLGLVVAGAGGLAWLTLATLA